MKFFVTVLIISIMTFSTYGLVIIPNLRFHLLSLKETPEVEYSIYPIRGSLSLVAGTSDIFLNVLKYKPIFFKISINYFDVDSFTKVFFIPFEDNIDNMDVQYEDTEGKKLEVIDNLIYNNSQPQIMTYYGCKNSKKSDKINMNRINLIIFKSSEMFKISVWNETFTAYSSLLGYIQTMNTAIEGNSDEDNEGVFNDLIEYCQKVAKFENKNYIPTFDDVYLEKHFTTSTSNYNPILIIVMILFIVIIITCFGYNDNA